MSKFINIKHKVKSINRKTDFYNLLEDAILTENEKRMMILYYIEGKPLNYIADELGYSVQGISKMHKRILIKLEGLL